MAQKLLPFETAMYVLEWHLEGDQIALRLNEFILELTERKATKS